MATISDVIQKFLKQPELITEVTAAGDEYYFRYAGHAFSIARRTTHIEEYGVYTLYTYPNYRAPLKQLADESSSNPDSIDMVAYHGSQFQTGREVQNLQRLYQLIQEKSYNLDAVFKEIVETEPPLF